jgi:hypothetical protein
LWILCAFPPVCVFFFAVVSSCSLACLALLIAHISEDARVSSLAPSWRRGLVRAGYRCKMNVARQENHQQKNEHMNGEKHINPMLAN